jgi:peptidoglycan L-alanyl-D-glutamate endopeptidase CwlK
MALVQLVPAESYDAEVVRLRQNNMQCLAPGFAERYQGALEECNGRGLDAVSFETCRCDELARLYFAHGASKSPNALYTWHHYGLAGDVVSKSREWDVYPDQLGKGGDPDWYRPVSEIFKAHGMDWGGDWTHFKDWPHWQFGGLRATPKDAVTILATKGILEVWRTVGAM